MSLGITVGVACAAAVAWALNLRLADVVMAYAPGAIEAMTIIAFALHLDPVFVGVHHLARFVFTSVLVPIAVIRIERHRAAKAASKDQKPK